MNCETCHLAKRIQTGVYGCPFKPGIPLYGYNAGCNRDSKAHFDEKYAKSYEAPPNIVEARHVLTWTYQTAMMSEVSLNCSACGMTRGPFRPYAELQKYVTEKGWLRGDGFSYCPDCRAKYQKSCKEMLETPNKLFDLHCSQCGTKHEPQAKGWGLDFPESKVAVCPDCLKKPAPDKGLMPTAPKVQRGRLWQSKEQDLYAVVTMVGVRQRVEFELFNRKTLTAHGSRSRSLAALKIFYELVEEPELVPGAVVAFHIPWRPRSKWRRPTWVLGEYRNTLDPEGFIHPLQIRYGANVYRRSRDEIVCLGKPGGRS